MSAEFLFGLILSIPIGFMINIFTPKFQNYFNRRISLSKRKRLPALKKELKKIQDLHNNKYKLYSYLISSIMVTLIGIFASLFLIHINNLDTLKLISDYVTNEKTINGTVNDVISNRQLSDDFGTLATLLIAMMMFGLLIELLITLDKLARFNEYQKELQTKINTIEQDANL